MPHMYSKTFDLEVIVDSHAVVRYKREIPCVLYPISSNGNVMQNYNAISQPGYWNKHSDYLSNDLIPISPVLIVFVCVYLFHVIWSPFGAYIRHCSQDTKLLFYCHKDPSNYPFITTLTSFCAPFPHLSLRITNWWISRKLCWAKKANPKMLHTVWFHLHNILEMEKMRRWITG